MKGIWKSKDFVEGLDGADHFPKGYENKFGRPTVRRGSLIVEGKDGDTKKQIMLLSWDAIPRCRGIRCPISSECLATSSDVEPPMDERCSLLMSYLKGVSLILFRNYADQLDEEKWTRVGLELLPLYKGLCRMKMVELGVSDIVSLNRSDNPVIHPIFKEIREQIKLIELIWKNLGLSGSLPEVGDQIPKVGGEGDLTYHDRLERQIEKQKKEKKGREMDEGE